MAEIGRMTGRLLVATAAAVLSGRAVGAQQEAVPHDHAELPSFPCSPPGTNGVYHESMSAQWSWHPSGRAVAYDRAIGGVSQIRVLAIETGVERCVTSGEAWDAQPSWSPDGTELAFVRGAEGHGQMQLLHLADGSIRPLTDGMAPVAYPAWSPDGARIAYVRWEAPGSRRRFVVVREVATGEERVVFDSPFGLNNLEWTPDGSAVALYSIDTDGWNDLYEAAADGSAVQRLTDNTVTDSYSATRAGDGTRIAFGQGAEASPFNRWLNYELYERDLGSGVVRRLTWAHLPDDRAHYAPDGRTLGYVSRASGYAEIVLMDADGSGLRQLTHQPETELTGIVERAGVDAAADTLRTLLLREPQADPVGERAASLLTHRLLARGRPRDALRVARMALEVHPDAWLLHTAYGLALQASGRPADARFALKRSLALEPDQVQLASALGGDDFLAVLDEIEGLYEDRASVVLDLARRLHRRGDVVTAAAIFRRLRAAHPDDPDVLAAQAYLLMLLGDVRAAVDAYRRVLELAPGHEAAAFHLRRIAALDPRTDPGR